MRDSPTKLWLRLHDSAQTRGRQKITGRREVNIEHPGQNRLFGFCVVTIDDKTVIVHAHDYLDRSPRFPFGKPGVDDRE